jgi:membrane protease YdiL (CAAX protease family)
VSRYPWKTLLFLVAVSTLTAPLIIPYADGLNIVATGHRLPLSLGSLVISTIIRNLYFVVPAAAVGLWVGPRIGLGAPYVQHWLDGGPRPGQRFSSIVGPALFWAVVTAIIAFAIDGFFRYLLGTEFPAPEIHARINVPWWRSVPASFWAPWAEEIFDRLFLLSLLVWLVTKLFRVTGNGLGKWLIIWFAIIATSLFFGWYHISNEAIFVSPVPPIVAVRTVLIITPVGLAFGWIYVSRGLEAAVLSHFLIDLIVHGVRPIVEHGLTT